jgi:hypothetical protein
MSAKSTRNRFVILTKLALPLVIILAACTPETVIPTITASTSLPPTFTLLSPSPTLPPTLTPLPPVKSKYSFENALNGWIPQTFPNAMACIKASQSDEKAKDGQYSLKLDMDLIGGDEHKNQGEAWVDMRNFPPLNATSQFQPIDLTNYTITMWVYAPSGSIGNNSKPNGFQVFVKDINYKSNYSSWTNVMENQWVELSLTVSASAEENGYVNQGFDPSQIIIIGIKMGSGGGSTSAFQGSVYIDKVDW